MHETPRPGLLILILIGWIVATGAEAQICRDDIPTSAPNDQLIDNGDGTVSDATTGLIWKQCAEGQSGDGCAEGTAATYTWQEALQVAADSSFGDQTDWRLPSKNELESLIEQRCIDPAINAERFPATPTTWFWSSSPNTGDGYQAWVVDFYTGSVEAYTEIGKEGANPIRLVRGGQTTAAFTLSVSITGSGEVRSADARIACPDTCTATYTDTSQVTLTANPSTGWQFLGWGGACTGTADCTLIVDGPLEVTANFTELTNRYQLDSPVNGSFESGIGVVYGWVCEATTITLQVDDATPFQAAYGAERSDSQAICADRTNGFAAAINWNDYDNGSHTLKLMADGTLLTDATVEVTSFGVQFLRGMSADTRVEDFPATGEHTELTWSEPHQNFVVGEAASTTLGLAASPDSASFNWESPQSEDHESGRALIRGWACEASSVIATLDGTAMPLPYGSGRADTQAICGDTNNGFAVAINWNDYADGTHQIALAIDGSTLETRTFHITTPAGQGTVTGVQQRHAVADFPYPGDQLTLQWSEPHQNFRLIDYQPMSDTRDEDWRVTEIYIATLGYAPDDEGLQYWVDNLQNGSWTPTEVAQSFFDAPLVQAMYPAGQDDTALIAALYQNIFGRAADTEGQTYWLGELAAARVTRQQMIIALLEGGWSNPDAAQDMARFGNRVRVGLAFAAAQAERGIQYSQLSSEGQTRLREIGATILQGVTADAATREAAIASIPDQLAAL